MMTSHTKGRVLPFDRSAEQVRSFANRRQAQGDPLKALELFQLSLQRDAQRPETQLDIARTYASMGCWTLSNEAYFPLLETEGFVGEAFFGMGGNFFSMQLYAAAHDCYLLALQKDPEAYFASDAVEMLDAIDEASRPLGAAEQKIRRRMGRVLEAMNRERASLAVRQIRRVLPLERRNGGVHALRAFALRVCGDNEQALAAARMAYKLSPRDVRCLCAMASALSGCGSKDAAMSYLSRAADQAALVDDLRFVIQTACEINEHAFVLSLLLPMEKQTPHQEELLHLCATASHNLGDTEGAVRRWRMLRYINPMDSIAAFRLEQAEQHALEPMLSYRLKVPIPETLQRLDALRVMVQEGNDALRTQWRQNDRLEYLIRWGLYCDDFGIPQVMCGVLATLGDEKARHLLKSLLCNKNATESVKQSALASLFRSGEKGPFYALMDDRMTLVHVSRAKAREGETAGREARFLADQAALWLEEITPREQGELRRISRLALQSTIKLSDAQKARAVAWAFSMKTGKPCLFSSTFANHRKIKRLAARLIREE